MVTIFFKLMAYMRVFIKFVMLTFWPPYPSAQNLEKYQSLNLLDYLM